MNNITKCTLAICVSLGVAFLYNVELTIAILLANLVSNLIIKDEDIDKTSEEEIMSMLPMSEDEVGEMIMLPLTKSAMCTCFIVIFYHMMTAIHI